MNIDPQVDNGIRENVAAPQDVYDNFNALMLGNDIRVLTKLVARTTLFQRVIDVPGDIVECGVYKGTGIMTWLKLKRILAPNAFKKVIGFDMFDADELLNTLDGFDKDRMSDMFKNRNFNYDSKYLQTLHNTIQSAGFSTSDYELIKGDISNTTTRYVAQRPGAKISLLYLDLDLETPTYYALSALWDRVSKGGLVVFDEYAYHQWSETQGADKFFANKNVKIQALPFSMPTAVVIKE